MSIKASPEGRKGAGSAAGPHSVLLAHRAVPHWLDAIQHTEPELYWVSRCDCGWSYRNQNRDIAARAARHHIGARNIGWEPDDDSTAVWGEMTKEETDR